MVDPTPIQVQQSPQIKAGVQQPIAIAPTLEQIRIAETQKQAPEIQKIEKPILDRLKYVENVGRQTLMENPTMQKVITSYAEDPGFQAASNKIDYIHQTIGDRVSQYGGTSAIGGVGAVSNLELFLRANINNIPTYGELASASRQTIAEQQAESSRYWAQKEAAAQKAKLEYLERGTARWAPGEAGQKAFQESFQQVVGRAPTGLETYAATSPEIVARVRETGRVGDIFQVGSQFYPTQEAAKLASLPKETPPPTPTDGVSLFKEHVAKAKAYEAAKIAKTTKPELVPTDIFAPARARQRQFEERGAELRGIVSRGAERFGILGEVPKGAADVIIGTGQMGATLVNIPLTTLETRGSILTRMAKVAPEAIATVPGQLVSQFTSPIQEKGIVRGGLYDIGQFAGLAGMAKIGGKATTEGTPTIIKAPKIEISKGISSIKTGTEKLFGDLKTEYRDVLSGTPMKSKIPSGTDIISRFEEPIPQKVPLKEIITKIERAVTKEEPTKPITLPSVKAIIETERVQPPITERIGKYVEKVKGEAEQVRFPSVKSTIGIMTREPTGKPTIQKIIEGTKSIIEEKTPEYRLPSVRSLIDISMREPEGKPTISRIKEEIGKKLTEKPVETRLPSVRSLIDIYTRPSTEIPLTEKISSRLVGAVKPKFKEVQPKKLVQKVPSEIIPSEWYGRSSGWSPEYVRIGYGGAKTRIVLPSELKAPTPLVPGIEGTPLPREVFPYGRYERVTYPVPEAKVTIEAPSKVIPKFQERPLKLGWIEVKPLEPIPSQEGIVPKIVEKLPEKPSEVPLPKVEKIVDVKQLRTLEKQRESIIKRMEKDPWAKSDLAKVEKKIEQLSASVVEERAPRRDIMSELSQRWEAERKTLSQSPIQTTKQGQILVMEKPKVVLKEPEVVQVQKQVSVLEEPKTVQIQKVKQEQRLIPILDIPEFVQVQPVKQVQKLTPISILRQRQEMKIEQVYTPFSVPTEIQKQTPQFVQITPQVEKQVTPQIEKQVPVQVPVVVPKELQYPRPILDIFYSEIGQYPMERVPDWIYRSKDEKSEEPKKRKRLKEAYKYVSKKRISPIFEKGVTKLFEEPIPTKKRSILSKVKKSKEFDLGFGEQQFPL